MRKITEIIIHCSATTEDKDFTVEDIDRWHRQRGFSGVGYHFIIRLEAAYKQVDRHAKLAHIAKVTMPTASASAISAVCRRTASPRTPGRQHKKPHSVLS